MRPLTIAERRRLFRMRPGGDAHAERAVALADRYGLTIPGIDSAAVASDARFIQDALILESRLEVVCGLVKDMRLEAQSRVWGAGTTVYTILARLVPRFPSLQRELTPMASFLARRYKSAPMSIRRQEKAALQRLRAKKRDAAPSEQEPSVAESSVTETSAVEAPAQ